MSLLQAASRITTVAIFFLNGFFFWWMLLCVFAGDRDCRSRDRFQRVCASRACIACKVQSANRHSLWFARRRLPHPHLSGMGFFFCTIDESTGDVLIFLRGMGFFSFEQSMRRLASPASSFFRGWGFSSFAQSMRRDSRESWHVEHHEMFSAHVDKPQSRTSPT